MNRKEFGNRDQKEKSRKLTKAEQKRLAYFEELSGTMEEQGYKKTELTISIVEANIFAVVFLIPVALIGVLLYLWKNQGFEVSMTAASPILFFAVFMACIVVHELIHGISWSLFAGDHFRDIDFGFMVQYLTPYCTCRVPLTMGQYIFGALMPMILLGILPMILGIWMGNFPLLLLGILMTDSAAGDIMIVWNILRYKSHAEDVVYVDHPTQGGGVIFER